MLSKSNENKLSTKTNRLLKIIYESVIQETFDFVGVMLLIDKVSLSFFFFYFKVIYLTFSLVIGRYSLILNRI